MDHCYKVEENSMDITNKKICVVGLGRSGYATAKFLHKQGASVFVTEQKMGPDIEKYAVKLKHFGIPSEIGGHNMYRINKADLIVVSPGVPPRAPLIKELKELKKTLVSEIEVASWFFKGTIVGVTGTNGKTTVTTLIERVLLDAGYAAKACGNIGTPFVSIVEKAEKDFYAVVELSSFQLYYSRRFRPHLGVLLNIAPDHFDWHTGMDEYARSKCKMFNYQRAHDHAVLNYKECKTCEKYLKSIKAHIVYFNKNTSGNNSNFDAVHTVATILGVPQRRIARTLNAFKGLEHRMEKVRTKKKITYINDSKSTSPHALEWALDKCGKNVVLICGGKNKGISFEPLRKTVTKNVKALIAMGEARYDIESTLGDCVDTTCVQSLKDALEKAREKAEKGDIVLFSPACASFDMFKNYKDRGKKFKELVGRV